MASTSLIFCRVVRSADLLHGTDKQVLVAFETRSASVLTQLLSSFRHGVMAFSRPQLYTFAL